MDTAPSLIGRRAGSERLVELSAGVERTLIGAPKGVDGRLTGG